MNFIDYHAHVFGTGYKVLYPKLDGLISITEVQNLVANEIKRDPDASWIVLRGWDQNLWDEKKFPSRADLDSVSRDIPIALIRIDGHALWCNSKALELARITETTQAPTGGEIVKDESNMPTGIVIDEAMKIVYDVIPQRSTAELINILRAGLKEFAKHHKGVHDMGIPAEWWVPYKQLYAEEGDSLIEANVFLDMTQPTGKKLFLDKVSSGDWNDSPHKKLKLVGIKLYLDGALGSRGAHLVEEYSDDKGNYGLRLGDDEEILSLMMKAYERNLQIATHAIGDAANARALDLYSKLRSSGVSSSSVLRIEHAQIVRPEDILRFKELDVWAVIQPQFWSSDNVWALQRLGVERMQNAYRWKSLHDAGIKLAASSDSPVEDADANLGVEQLVRRVGEGLSKTEAVKLYEEGLL